MDLDPVSLSPMPTIFPQSYFNSVPSLLSRRHAFKGEDMPTLLAFLSALLPQTSCPRNSTDAVAGWGDGDAYSGFQGKLLIMGGLKGKFLQKGSEENKQLSLGQLFSKACPLS